VFLAKDSNGNKVVLKTIPSSPLEIVLREATVMTYLSGFRGV
jgi:hypothetical protein